MSGSALALVVEAHRLFGQYLDKIERSAGLLTTEQAWWRPNPACNTVGNLILHLCGNLSQWVLAGLGGQGFERRRREEFAAAGGVETAELLRRLREVVAGCRAVVERLSEADLERTLVIQGYTHTGFGALLHTVEHMSYHTGQIVATAKQILGEQAGIEFYPDLR